MDHYTQPRPALYGTEHDEPALQTQTGPVRAGPPRYPPAPPLAGDAPEPFEWRPRIAGSTRELGAVPLAFIYALASLYSLLLILQQRTGTVGLTVERTVLISESVISLFVVALILQGVHFRRALPVWYHSGRRYLVVL